MLQNLNWVDDIKYQMLQIVVHLCACIYVQEQDIIMRQIRSFILPQPCDTEMQTGLDHPTKTPNY
jgi:hypothetical protein